MSSKIKTWQERAEAELGYHYTKYKSDNYMLAEITDLRAALAGCQQTISEYADLLRTARIAVELAATQAPSAATIKDSLTVQAPSAPVGVCDECHGTGVQHAGYSGQDSDGNAPISEPCSECGYGDSAPVAPDTAEDWLRQRYGAARGHHAWRDLTEAFNAGAALSVKVETAAIPEGWRLVPIEPTEAMLSDVDEKVGGHCYSCSAWSASWDDCKRVYAALLAAAPTPPTTGGE